MNLRWTHGGDADFVTLTRELDTYLQGINGDRQSDYAPYNIMNSLAEVALLYSGETPVACGALRMHEGGVAEIKRMFVAPDHRRSGLAKQLLIALETRAKALGCTRLVLETNPTMEGAVGLYQSYGFSPIEPFGPYRDLPTLCMGKAVR